MTCSTDGKYSHRRGTRFWRYPGIIPRRVVATLLGAVWHRWLAGNSNYRRDTGRAYIGTCPSRSSVVSVCRRISELTHRRYGLLDQGTVVRRLNRAMTGWANYFQLGQVSPAYRAVDAHAIRRLRQWLCRKHKVRAGKYVRFPDKRLWNDLGRARLAQRTARFPWAKA